MFRVTKSKMATTLAIAVMAFPAAAYAVQDFPGAGSSETAGQGQDLRSADALDASIRADARQSNAANSPDPRDLRSPDARDAAAGRGTFSAPEVTVVRITEPAPSASGGLDWGDAGIGAGSLLGLILVGVGGTMFLLHRRHGAKPAPTA
jgi:hypothetical protein